ncbi:MAG TPA: PIN domain-containing protein [Solirubrobacterales bacterium]|nr:PIN domain-containing protein [Solirubrobacterales bacterium]
MPGHSAEQRPWGKLPLVLDTSAWARIANPAVHGPWREALLEGQLRLSPVARLEFLLSAQDAATFDALTEELSTIRPAPLTPAVVGAAEEAMRALAHRSAGSQRLPVVDYLVAAAAQELGAAVLHYDRDYDRLAEVMEFESVWLAPPGTLP